MSPNLTLSTVVSVVTMSPLSRALQSEDNSDGVCLRIARIRLTAIDKFKWSGIDKTPYEIPRADWTDDLVVLRNTTTT